MQPFASLLGMVGDDVPRLLINREKVGEAAQGGLARLFGRGGDSKGFRFGAKNYRDALRLVYPPPSPITTADIISQFSCAVPLTPPLPRRPWSTAGSEGEPRESPPRELIFPWAGAAASAIAMLGAGCWRSAVARRPPPHSVYPTLDIIS